MKAGRCESMGGRRGTGARPSRWRCSRRRPSKNACVISSALRMALRMSIQSCQLLRWRVKTPEEHSMPRRRCQFAPGQVWLVHCHAFPKLFFRFTIIAQTRFHDQSYWIALKCWTEPDSHQVIILNDYGEEG